MICVAALIVFAILAIFSAKYRPLAKEAFDCVFRKLTLRKCQSGLDRRVRVGAMMPFVKRAPRVAKFIYDAFPVLSGLFVLLTVASFGYMAYGGYNYVLYGNCNGPGSTGFCVFDPNGPGSSHLEQCRSTPATPEYVGIPADEQLVGFKTFNPTGTKTVVFFGCYSCAYTRKGAPALFAEIAKRPDVRFILVDFPLPGHEGAEAAATAGNCVYDENPADYIGYAQQLYAANLSQGVPPYSNSDWSVCVQTVHPRVLQGKALGKTLHLYGTPTYVINGKVYVGPLNERSLDKLIGS
jgi:hypothetical protein